MPLLKGKSEKAFKHNVEAEMHAGKPQKQSLAIAYSMKRKGKKKMAGGGDPADPVADSRLQSHAHERQMVQDLECNEEHEHDRHDSAGEPMMSEGGECDAEGESDMWGDEKIRDEKMMAEGGQITDNYQSPSTAMHQTKDGDVDPQDAYAPGHEGNIVRPNQAALSEDERRLNQHGMYEIGRYGHEGHYAAGGQITDNYADTEDGDGRDMVGRIMVQRRMEYSKGGQVANNTDQGWHKGERRDDLGSGQYDDLVMRDDNMEDADYTSANSGDELSDDREDHDRSDIVSRIMKSRARKSSMDGMSGYGRSDRPLK
jgi:hypothetical protein